jgi:transcriptional regulator with XRE-family HTH domain
MTDVGRMIHHMSEMKQSTVPDWTLGWRMQRALDFAGIKAGDMAEALEVTRSTVSRWMHDSGTPPRKVYLRQWAEMCGVPFDWLAEGDHRGTTGWSSGDDPLGIPVTRHELVAA